MLYGDKCFRLKIVYGLIFKYFVLRFWVYCGDFFGIVGGKGSLIGYFFDLVLLIIYIFIFFI